MTSRMVITENDTKDPALLLRALRKLVSNIGDIEQRVSSVETRPSNPTAGQIRDALQANGQAPLNLTALPGQTFQPQVAIIPRYTSLPPAQILQQHRDQQAILVLGTGTSTSAYNLYTVVEGNPTTAVRITIST